LFLQRKIIRSDRESLFGDASKNGHIKIVKFLFQSGINIHAYDEYALRWSIHYGHKDVVEFLLQNGANALSIDNDTLNSASKNGHHKVVIMIRSYM
jgi:ankyrin repeat protein